VTAGFALFVVAWTMLLLIAFGFPYDPRYRAVFGIVFGLFPWTPLAKGFQDLAWATGESRSKGLGFRVPRPRLGDRRVRESGIKDPSTRLPRRLLGNRPARSKGLGFRV
jgi:hypothetical protein